MSLTPWTRVDLTSQGRIVTKGNIAKQTSLWLLEVFGMQHGIVGNVDNTHNFVKQCGIEKMYMNKLGSTVSITLRFEEFSKWLKTIDAFLI